MLYKDDILKILKEVEIPVNEYCISSGATLVIHGVKKWTNDIDLACSTNLVEEFIKKGCNSTTTRNNSRIVEINEYIEIIENWFPDEIVLIDELPIASLESIKKQKAELGREKDFKDIELIDSYINNFPK